MSLIQRRSARGIDADGDPFKPYSASYAAKKGETGRSVSPPDLTLTGAMLRSLKVKAPTSGDARGLMFPPQAIIGVEGQHRNTRFKRNEQAYDIEISSSRDTRTRRNKDGTTTTYRQVADKYRRNKSKEAGYTLQRLPSTTPMATLVQATHKHRPWFAVRTAAELRSLANVFSRVMGEEIKRYNTATNRTLPPASGT